MMTISRVSSVATGLVLSAGLFTGACAFAQSKQSDAQVEANVLKALAGAPELATQNIQTSTTYGQVTITGNVHDEAMRTKAETIVSRVPGVTKVVDELALGDAPAQDANAPQTADNQGPPLDANGQPMVLQSDGTYAPAAPPDNQSAMAPAPDSSQGQPPQYADQQGPPPNGQPDGQGQPPAGRRPLYNGAAPNQGPGDYPPQGYPPQGYPQRPMQRAGLPVVIPPGAMLAVRINRGIDSQHIKPGTPFDGTVMQDVVAGGAVAIPRGATVFGVVADAQKTKALSGRGELALQITGVQLAGQNFPVQTNVWNRVGRDKTTSTVNHGVVGGVFGALIGAAVGGGKGAAIGAGVGAGAGVASSAGSPGGDVLIRPESVVVFHTNAPTNVVTVSEQEMQRLAYMAGPGGPGPRYYRRVPPPPPGYYYYR